MKNHVIEVVSFKLAKGVSDDDFLATQPSLKKFLDTCEGFINRRLSISEDGLWLDHVEWASMEAAKAAAEDFTQQESLKPLMQAIDMPSVSMHHNLLQVSIG